MEVHKPFSTVVQKAFDKWMQSKTWFSGNPSDEEPFFRFVWTVSLYSRRPPSEDEVYQAIINAQKGFDPDYLEQRARELSSLYVTLLAFAKARKKIGL